MTWRMYYDNAQYEKLKAILSLKYLAYKLININFAVPHSSIKDRDLLVSLK